MKKSSTATNQTKKSEDEHSVFNQVRTMTDEIKRDRTIITDLANQDTLESTVISKLANKLEQQGKSVTADETEIAMLRRQMSEERVKINTEASRIQKEAANLSSCKNRNRNPSSRLRLSYHN